MPIRHPALLSAVVLVLLVAGAVALVVWGVGSATLIAVLSLLLTVLTSLVALGVVLRWASPGSG